VREPSPAELRQRCLDALLAAGAVAAGVGGVDPLEEAREIIESRRRAGLHGGMAFTYRNPQRSCDPRSALPSARSLVVAAVAYRSERAAPPEEPAAEVARYASEPTRERLRAVLGAAAAVLEEAGRRAVVVADDNALVDRAVAHRAGLGWFGRNTNLLVPGVGSWVVLGSVLTDADLEPPPPSPMADRCGSCRRCLDACPTGALIEPGVLDADRCLSWLLQTTGELPDEHRVALGARIYGCDDCQSACPVNRLAPVVPVAGGGPGDFLTLGWLLSASDEELMHTLRAWYVPRREARYVRRNALVVLGNLGQPLPAELLEHLARWLRCDDPMLVEHARWAARRLGRVDLITPAAVAERDHPGENRAS
jgi:epoxyqueuosine reductase